MKRELVFVILCGHWLLTSGCCHLPMGKLAPAPQPLSEALAAPFRTEAAALPATVKRVRTKRAFVVDQVELAAPPDRFGTDHSIKLDCYRPTGSGRKAIVMILPISGGNYELERHFAGYFARRGFAVVMVRRRKPDRTPTTGEATNALLQQAIIDDRRALDWIESQPEFDATRIGVFGVSIGGIRGALLAPLDQRVRASVLALAAGDLAYVLAHTTERGYSRHRRVLLRERQMTLAELEQEFRSTFSCDPLRYAPYVDRARVLLVLARFDKAVPFRKGWELREAMGRPETIILPSGHFTALLCLPYLRCQALKFLRTKLAVTPSR
jgi:hypothetical protein